jgi:TRAP-type C4-dicarboxylate transport system permease small subunit
MDNEPGADIAPSGLIAKLSRAAALFGGSLVLFAGALIVVSITTRWLFSRSITGDVELIQAATAVAAFAFLPLGQITRSTIVVDTFTKRLSPRTCRAIDAFWDLVYALFSLILAWRLAIGAWDALRSHTVTTVLGLPVAWFMAVGTILVLLLCAAAWTTAVRLLANRGRV